MTYTRLTINTAVQGRASTPITKTESGHGITPVIASSSSLDQFSTIRTHRLRSGSNASTSSYISVISPTASSTNGSSTCLPLQNDDRTQHPSAPNADYVLAMHDFVPQHQNATCLSFKAGQVIHVLNRDSSGWWDGDLEGRRGWFPSNYVNADVACFSHQDPTDADTHTIYKPDDPLDRNESAVNDHASVVIGEADGDTDLYCPPLMVPLLHGIALLQNAVRAKRVTHYQPSTACIISCVRSVLSAAECLPREATLLRQFPVLAQERKQILSILASLVAQAKKASEVTDSEEHNDDVQNMLRLGGQVFSQVQRFLALAVQCGVELPERRRDSGSIDDMTLYQDDTQRTFSHFADRAVSPDVEPSQDYTLHSAGLNSVGQTRRSEEFKPLPSLVVPTMTSSSASHSSLRPRNPRNGIDKLSVSSIASSSSSYSSLDSGWVATTSPFPSGPSTAAQVIEALRSTHDQYLSTIAAFIGHAHSHTRSSHASSTGYLYDLIREIVEIACRLLTIVESVIRHSGISSYKLGNLKTAKESLYNVISALAESVRLLTMALPVAMSEEEEKQHLLRSATGALKAGADCVAATKICLSYSNGEDPLIIYLPKLKEPGPGSSASFEITWPNNILGALNRVSLPEDEDLTIQAQAPILVDDRSTNASPILDTVNDTDPSSSTTRDTLAELHVSLYSADDPSVSSPTLEATDDGTIWGVESDKQPSEESDGEKIINGETPFVDSHFIAENREVWMLRNDYGPDDIAYNTDGHLVGATLEVLVAKMTPHDSIVDPAFSAVFFLTFRLFSSPEELVRAIIARYNVLPPPNLRPEDLHFWQQRKGIPVRLRVSNFIKLWLETYWRPSADDVVLSTLATFTQDGLSAMFPGPSTRILELIDKRRNSGDVSLSPKGDRIRDPGMSINPPVLVNTSEIPRPTMTKTLLAALRSKNFPSISITDFDTLELARQLTVMECRLYCAIQPEEILETGQEGAKPPVHVRAMSTLSTVITGWVAESILNEHDTKKRTLLVKFFIKVADRCISLHNYSTPRSILAALDSSTISRLHQTWQGLPQKNRVQLDALRKLADHSRNYHEYRTTLRNTAPPAVPFLGLYLTDVTFCREGNPNFRVSPTNPEKNLLNFNKYHKLARIVQDMQRFQVEYNLKVIPEVQSYLTMAFNDSTHRGDLQDLYRRSLLVEPRQPADSTPATDQRNLFNWTSRSPAQFSTPAPFP